MYATIGERDSKFSCPTLVNTEIDTCHDLFWTMRAAEEYIEEQTGQSVDDDQCPLRVVEIVELEDESTTE
ncbi:MULTISPECIES: hypothetical protein [Halococcus]|jgi:hypothetical protein|uniref:Uncharacterized protein n=2 Tax=Halococcus TaxID=2249 RepID=M0MWA0_9EURY|nr:MULTISPECIES: hypothetical protein [Halococcus]EMA49104.1 hypothetical protein C451_19493 [Halococcus thailandensis JCM 13552]UOO96585.1 hypothetical protein MUK72_15425 [Halococcus dombrowskii]